MEESNKVELRSVLAKEPRAWDGQVAIYQKPQTGRMFSGHSVATEFGKMGPLTNLIVAHLARYLTVVRRVKQYDLTLLDLGSGFCELQDTLYRHRCRVWYVGQDVNLKYLKSAETRPGNRPRMYVLSDVRKKLPLNDESFDMVAAFEIIEHMTKRQGHAFLREIHRVLKPNGICFLSTVMQPFCGNGHSPFHTHEYTFPELSSMLKKHPFIIEDVFGIGAFYRELKKHLSTDEKAIYDEYRKRLPPFWVNHLFALTRPEYSWDVEFILRKEK